jgi:hypothetical protein
MTAVAIRADTNHSPARQALLWVAAFALTWMLLIAWRPAISESGIAVAAVRLTVQALMGLGLWLALERSDLSAGQRRGMWVTVVAVTTLWLAIAWSAAIKGMFTQVAYSGPPLLPIAILGPLIVGAPVLLRSKRMGQLLDAMPASWLVGLQTYRVFGATFLAYALRGTLPGLFGYPAGIGDALTGIFALAVAIGVAAPTAEGRRRAVIWNLFGLADLAIAVSLGVITSAGPLQSISSSAPGIGVSGYPTVMTPAFAVPSSILLHLLSLRQLRRRGAANEMSRRSAL